MLHTNATMRVSVGNAGELRRIGKRRRVQIAYPSNLPDNGIRDGKQLWFATSCDGIETMVYESEFRLDRCTSLEYLKRS